jgi:hypothetical protein
MGLHKPQTEMNMKKILTIIIMNLLFATIFAETYKVTNVVGKVFVDSEQVVVGQVLSDEDILNVRPQAAITLQIFEGTEKRTFKGPNNKIAVKNAWIESGFGKGGLKKMTIVRANAVAPDIEKTRPGVQTAASRASEAKEDFEWDE